MKTLNRIFSVVQRIWRRIASWYDNLPDKRQDFVRNLGCGVVIILITHLVSFTGVGQRILNESYDFLVQQDFAWAVVYRNLFTSSATPSQAEQALLLVDFDEAAQVDSSGRGFWTPRAKLNPMY